MDLRHSNEANERYKGTCAELPIIKVQNVDNVGNLDDVDNHGHNGSTIEGKARQCRSSTKSYKEIQDRAVDLNKTTNILSYPYKQSSNLSNSTTNTRSTHHVTGL